MIDPVGVTLGRQALDDLRRQFDPLAPPAEHRGRASREQRGWRLRAASALRRAADRLEPACEPVGSRG